MKKVCVVTGSRAEYGLLSRLMTLMKTDSEISLQVIATNMHLSSEFGLTYREIEEDGFHINEKVAMLLSSDTPNATVKSIGLGMIGFADAYEHLDPDMVLVLGDRYELLSSVTTALFYKIPIAHIHGGEVTEGAYDDSIRHAITKMSHLHFTSTAEYRKRVIQLGEPPESVFYVGALGCDNIRSIQLMGKDELERSMGFQLDRNTVLVTYHPVTLEDNTAEQQFRDLLAALDGIDGLRMAFTMPNSDTYGRVVMELIKEYVDARPDRSIWFNSLGMKRYLSALQFVGAVVGNSSSGILEVPSFHIPTVNIGDRQKGRIRAGSVVDCLPQKEDIEDKLRMVLQPEFRQKISHMTNPYDKPGTAEEILRIIKQSLTTTNKKFFDIEHHA